MNTILPYQNNRKQLARQLARIAVRALYLEVKSHPKPGLVSFISPGGHIDMDGELFYRSLFSLRHYFYCLVIEDKAEGKVDRLKKIGLEAEQHMLIATDGVNTHRGALFALGIVCISTARVATIKPNFNPLDLHTQIIADWKEYLSQHHSLPNSHGQQVLDRYPVIGAKTMAIQGYPIIFQILTPFLLLFHATASLDCACLYAYAGLLSTIDDTNILYRKGMTGLNEAKQHAQFLLSIDCLEERHDHALLLHQRFSEQRLSPGGVGDLIAVTLFMGQLFSNALRRFSPRSGLK